MSALASPFYVTGGTLRHDAPSYVERQADRDLLDGLLKGEFCYVLTSRQMGKSSLMVRTANKLREQGVRVAVLDLTAVGQPEGKEQWYFGLLTRLGVQTRLEDELEDFWQDHPQLGPVQRFFAAIQAVLLGNSLSAPGRSSAPVEGADHAGAPSRNRLVIFVDELDVVRSLSFGTDEFFAAIRECYTRRAEDAEFERLTFCLLGVATPTDLIRDTRLTPFNIGRRIVLNDFTEEEAASLGHGLVAGARAETGGTGMSPVPPGGVAASTAAQTMFERILYWTNGHPYLTQRLCQAVSEWSVRREADAGLPLPSTGRGIEGEGWEAPEALSTPQLRPDTPLTPALSPLRGEGDGRRRRAANALHIISAAPEMVDQLCEELFFSARAREQDDNLLFVRERLLRSEVDLAALLTLYEQVHQGRRIVDDEANPLVSLLRLAGIVRAKTGQLVVRNGIYARVFDRAWVRANMPDADVRRQRVAFWQGVARTSAAAVLALGVFAALAVYAMRQKRLAEAHLYVADMEVALQSWEAGNYGRTRELVHLHRDAPPDLRGFEWRYLWKLCQGDEEYVLGEHESRVYLLAFSPDGRTLVTGSGDYVLKAWDVAARRCRFTLADLRPRDCFLSDGTSMLVESVGQRGRGDVYRLDLASGQSARLLVGAGQLVRLLADGRTLATTQRTNIVRFWDSTTLEERFHIPGLAADGARAGSTLLTVAVSRDGQRAFAMEGSAANYQDEGITVWDVPARRPLVKLVDRRPLTRMRLSPDERWLAVGDMYGGFRVWNLDSTNEPPLIRAHSTIVGDIAFSPDGRTLATGSSDQTIKLWTFKGDAAPVLNATLRGHEGPVHGLAFSPDGGRLASGGRDQTIRLWKLDHAPRIDVVPGIFDDAVFLPQMFFLPDNKTLMGNSASGVKFWDLDRMQLRATLPGPEFAWHVSLDGKAISTIGTNAAGARMFRVWDVPSQTVAMERPGTGILPFVATAAMAPGGRVAVFGGGDGHIQFWDISGWHELARHTNHTKTIRSLIFSRDGRVLFSSSDDASVWVWDMTTRRPLTRLTGMRQVIQGLALSPDERTLAVGSGDTRIYLWDWRARNLQSVLKGHRQGIFRLDFSPDGRTLASSSSDGTVKLWNVGLHREIATLKIESDGVSVNERINYVGFSPDGNLLVARTYLGTVKVWRAPSWEEIHAAEAAKKP